jgi:hypothetical protein
MVLNVLFRKTVKLKGSHCHPNNFVSVASDCVDELVVAIVDIITPYVVAVESANVGLGESAINIADNQSVVIGVQEYLTFNEQFFNFVTQNVPPHIQPQAGKLHGGEFVGLDVPILVEGQLQPVDGLFVDHQLDFDALHIGRGGTNAGKEFGGPVLSRFVFHDKDVGDSLVERGFVEGRAKDVGSFGAGREQIHIIIKRWQE